MRAHVQRDHWRKRKSDSKDLLKTGDPEERKTWETGEVQSPVCFISSKVFAILIEHGFSIEQADVERWLKTREYSSLWYMRFDETCADCDLVKYLLWEIIRFT